MPSVRVRRGSQYRAIGGEDGAELQGNVPAGRPRSRTIASIYRTEGLSPATLPAVASPSEQFPSEGRKSDTEVENSLDKSVTASPYDTSRPSSKIEDSILSKKRSANMVRGQKSLEPLWHRPGSSDGQMLHGSHADIVVPGDGQPGRVESALSLSSAGGEENPFHSSTESLNHDDDIVEHLEVIDPQIATISSLTNAANSIMIPPIGVYSRKPVFVLPRTSVHDDYEKGSSVHEDELDRHVEEVLSKRAKIRRTLKGVWSFIKTPMGVIVAIYGFLVVFWGAAIVFFLAKFINFHNSSTQGFWVEVSSQVENALFTVTGVGLLPWRVIDTYRILRIWHYKRLTRRMRAKAELPVLYDEDDLPDPMYDPNYVHVLSDKQQERLHYQQQQFMKSQTWYRPHGTATHRAFPINTALLICCFIDGNSIFQCILCGTMWGLNRFQRPAWSTGILIPASFICGIVSGVLIWRGGEKTKRTKEVEKRLREALAMESDPKQIAVVQDEIIHKSAANVDCASNSDAGQIHERSSELQLDTATNRVSAGESNTPSSIYVEEKMLVPRNILQR